CRRIRAAYEGAVKSLKLDVPVSMDFGISVHPQDGEQKETLLKLADERLYHQKNSSRSQPPRASAPERAPEPREKAPPQSAPVQQSVPPESPEPREYFPPRERVAERPVSEEKAAPRETATPRVTPPPEEQFTPRAVPTPHEIPASFVAPSKAREPEPPVAPHGQPGAREQRKWERVSLSGTRAYATLGEGMGSSAQVLDLSYGGVAIQVENPDDLPNQFHAILHVPILPPVRVSLRKVYTLRTEGPRSRIGCAFVS
ncbi:MAG: hypothetical protein ACRD4K_17175, partial [Candidatus Acidiferrales bacterium]